MDTKNIENWIHRYFEHDLNSQELAEFKKLLSTSEKARRMLVEHSQFQVELTKTLGVELPGVPTKIDNYMRYAAAAIILVLLGWGTLVNKNSNGIKAQWNGEVSSIFQKEIQKTPFPQPGKIFLAHKNSSLILAGHTIQFLSPSLFSYDTDLQSDGRYLFQLETGHIQVETAKDRAGLNIETPIGKVLNLGTSFELQLNPVIEAQRMVRDWLGKSFTIAAYIEVLQGAVQFQGKALNAIPVKILPQMGKIALSENTNIGKLADSEGLVQIRPATSGRWTSAPENTEIIPGDSIKTGARGLNVAEVLLKDGSRIILAPNTQIKIQKLQKIDVMYGEVFCDTKSSIVLKHLKNSVKVTRSSSFRVIQGKLVEIKSPQWLTGYLKRDNTESLGSLLANVDGRNVALTIGYHKVNVDIRDQIARTTVEESFVNHTHRVLEGVFYFPLPQDASISGFAMWIGNELVEGEIVEKQKARRIYEQILWEKRDPALLEWTGGNIFKARVFPIGHEKRIRITYTQILPKVGQRYHYNYALRSELLQKTPLKNLEIDVKLHSQEALETVECSTHSCEIDKDSNNARVKFQAQQYTPKKDFELTIATQQKSPLQMITHQRDRDGYFMLLYSPSRTTKSSRNLLQDSKPLDIVIAVDTSGSANSSRDIQMKVLEELLSSLTKQDRLNVFTGDNQVRKAFPKNQPATDKNKKLAWNFVQQRRPLGTSDLDILLGNICKSISKDTHVIYLGDGIPTTRDGNPSAFAERLKKAYQGGNFHAIACGNSYEDITLRAMSKLGQGSLRYIKDPQNISQNCRELMQQIISPGIQNLQFTISGMTTAAVYPKTFANLPIGSQYVVLGRYIPRQDQSLNIAVSGSLTGKNFSKTHNVKLDSNDIANSFIPRLWARHHLDHLLQQQSQDIEQQIIALSEEYQIITPYTSFLVLESDEDRKRFQVTKRFRMRDGEEFFQEGIDKVNYALKRKQMLSAKQWRLQIYKQVMNYLSGMGRDLTLQLEQSDAASYPLSGSFGYKQDTFFSSYKTSKHKMPASKRDKIVSDRLDYRDGNEIVENDALVDDRTPAPLQSLVRSNEREESSLRSQLFSENQRKRKSGRLRSSRLGFSHRGDIGARTIRNYYNNYLTNIFPQVPNNAKLVLPDWPAETLQLLKNLSMKNHIAQGKFAYEFFTNSVSYNRQKQDLHRINGKHLLSANSWFVSPMHYEGDSTQLQWLYKKQRGILKSDWLLGNVRPQQSSDAQAYPAPFSWWFDNIAYSYHSYQCAVTKNQVIFTREQYKIVVTVDKEKGIITKVETFSENQKTSSVEFLELVEVSGKWWPQKVVHKNAQDEISQTIHVKVRSVSLQEFAKLLEQNLPDKNKSIIVAKTDMDLNTVRQNIRENRGEFSEYWHMLRYYMSQQRWKKAEVYKNKIHDLVSHKWGWKRIHLGYLAAHRKHQILKQELAKLIDLLKAKQTHGEYSIIGFCMQQYMSLLNQGNEGKIFLEKVLPVLQRYQKRPNALLDWDQRMLSALHRMGKVEEALKWHEQLCKKYQYNYGMHTNYAHSLANNGEAQRAIEYLKAQAKKDHWLDYGLQQIQNNISHILWNHHRYDEFIEHVEKHSLHSFANQYLSALIMTGKSQKASQLQQQWLAILAEKTTAQQNSQITAAVNHAFGRGNSMYSNQFDLTLLEPLEKLARYYFTKNDQVHIAQSILTNYSFSKTNLGNRLVKDLIEDFLQKFDTMSLIKIEQFFSVYRNHRENLEVDLQWQVISDKIYSKLLAEKVQYKKHRWLQIISSHFPNDYRINFYRKLLTKNYDTAAQKLFYALLGETWSSDIEQETLSLIAKLKNSNDAESKNMRITGLYRWVSWVYMSRTSVALKAQKTSEMSRKQLQNARDTEYKKSREHIVRILQQVPKVLVQDIPKWIIIEKIYQQVKLSQNTSEIYKDVKDTLLQLQKTSETEMTKSQGILCERYLCTLLYLSILDKNKRQDVRKILEQAIENKFPVANWNDAKYRFLIATEDITQLQKFLQKLFGGGKNFSNMDWGRDYAYLLAEQGKIQEAIEVFEKLRAWDVLTTNDYNNLSKWYMIVDNKKLVQQSRLDSFKVLNENQLYQWLQQKLSGYRRTGDNVPGELDDRVPQVFVTLFHKAQHPQNYVWLLRQYYENTRDFRLLECLPEAVIGLSSQKIYPFLEHLNNVTQLLQDEATLDRIYQHLHAVEKDLTESDRRALSLLEFVIEHRAATQSQGSNIHKERARAALQKAFKKQWYPGEPRLMAKFIAHYTSAPLAEIQLQQLRSLYTLKLSENDRLSIGGNYSKVLWSYQKRSEAIVILEGALEEFRKVYKFSNSVQQEISRYLQYCQELGRHKDAENFIHKEMQTQYSIMLQRWWKIKLYNLHYDALKRKAPLNSGQHQELYDSTFKMISYDLQKMTSESHASQTIRILKNIWHSCHDMKYQNVARDIRSFAFQQLPKILRMYHHRQGQSMVSVVRDSIERNLGKMVALEFLVVRAENEPDWVQKTQLDFWRYQGYKLVRYRSELENEITPTLSERIKIIFLEELKKDLSLQKQNHYRYGYSIANSYFWKQQKSSFFHAAMKAAEKHRGSSMHVAHIAKYLYRDLYEYQKAIAILQNAYQRKILLHHDMFVLGDYLQQQKRYRESIVVFLDLTEKQPQNLTYWTHLMYGYFHSAQSEKLQNSYQNFIKNMDESNKRNESNIALLANACLNTELYDEAIIHYNDVIQRHKAKRTHRQNSTFSSYYQKLAQAYIGKNMVNKAVDAAAGAILYWGHQQYQRQAALQNLQQILQRIANLDGYVERFEKKVRENKTDSAVIRHALGTVYSQRKNYTKAIHHLQQAFAMQPHDKKLLELLLQTYDNNKQSHEAVAMLYQFSNEARDITIFENMARRLDSFDKEEATRAYSNMVEVTFHESQGHKRLAEIHSSQRRWKSAEYHWRQVIRVRSEEPEGYLGLAKVLIQQKNWEEARSTINNLLNTSWHSRFGNVHNKAKQLQKQLK